MVHAFGGIGRKPDATRLQVLLEQVVEPRFIDGRLTPFEHVDLPLIDIDAEDMIAHFSEAYARDQTNITGAENRQAHM